MNASVGITWTIPRNTFSRQEPTSCDIITVLNFGDHGESEDALICLEYFDLCSCFLTNLVQREVQREGGGHCLPLE